MVYTFDALGRGGITSPSLGSLVPLYFSTPVLKCQAKLWIKVNSQKLSCA